MLLPFVIEDQIWYANMWGGACFYGVSHTYRIRECGAQVPQNLWSALNDNAVHPCGVAGWQHSIVVRTLVSTG